MNWSVKRLSRFLAPRRRVIQPAYIIIVGTLMLLAAYQAGMMRAMREWAERSSGIEIPAISSSPTATLDMTIGQISRPFADVSAANATAEMVTARLSNYWPPLGGINCSLFVGSQCVSRMASGERWQDWIGKAAACPPEVPFWTRIVLPGGEEFVCLDQGGKIVTEPDGSIWIDLLVEKAPVPYGTKMQVRLLRP